MKRLASSRVCRNAKASGSELLAMLSSVAIRKPHVMPPTSMSTTATNCSRALDAETATSPYPIEVMVIIDQ